MPGQPLAITDLGEPVSKLRKKRPRERVRENAEVASALGEGQQKAPSFARNPKRTLLVSGKRDGNFIQRSERDGTPKGMPKAIDAIKGVKKVRSSRRPMPR